MYEERVTFHPIVQVAYLAGVAALVWGQLQAVPTLPWVTFVVGVPLLILPLMFGRLLIRMDAETLFVEFGYLGWPLQKVPLANIVRASVVTYKPIRNFGGWGIRAGKLDGEHTSVYTVRGTSGVLLELSTEQRVSGWKTKRFLVGSGEPDRLAAAIGRP